MEEYKSHQLLGFPLVDHDGLLSELGSHHGGKGRQSHMNPYYQAVILGLGLMPADDTLRLEILADTLRLEMLVDTLRLEILADTLRLEILCRLGSKMLRVCLLLYSPSLCFPDLSFSTASKSHSFSQVPLFCVQDEVNLFLLVFWN